MNLSELHKVAEAMVAPGRGILAVDESTAELMSPSLFHWSINDAFFRNALLATPMFDGSRLPALLVPKM